MITTDKFIERAKNIHGNRYDYSQVEYIHNAKPVRIICKEHGEFLQTPNVHLKPCNCPQCAGAGKKNTKIFIEQAKKIHGDKFNYSKVDYKKDREKVIIICSTHGEFLQLPNSHLQGHGCNKCKHETKSSKDSFLKKAINKHGFLYDYSKLEYKGSKQKVTIICPTHGDFEIIAYHHLSGKGCPKCFLKAQAKIFNMIILNFPNLEIIWEARLEWLKGQRFDIYIPSINMAIEYNGKQHYEPIDYMGGNNEFLKTQQRDIIKREKCLQNNCELHELKYDYKKEDLINLFTRIHALLKTKEQD